MTACITYIFPSFWQVHIIRVPVVFCTIWLNFNGTLLVSQFPVWKQRSASRLMIYLTKSIKELAKLHETHPVIIRDSWCVLHAGNCAVTRGWTHISNRSSREGAFAQTFAAYKIVNTRSAAMFQENSSVNLKENICSTKMIQNRR